MVFEIDVAAKLLYAKPLYLKQASVAITVTASSFSSLMLMYVFQQS